MGLVATIGQCGEDNFHHHRKVLKDGVALEAEFNDSMLHWPPRLLALFIALVTICNWPLSKLPIIFSAFPGSSTVT